MALVYAVQGAFWPLLAIHLGDLGISERGRGWIFATLAIASFAMPLGAGQLVDRLMPTQMFLAGSFAAGTLILAAIAATTSSSVLGMFGLFLAYWLILAPSYALSSSLAFRNLAHPERDFGRVRLWGTVGWMVVGWVVSGVMAVSGSNSRGAFEALWIAVGLSAVTAVYCWFLPNTPPLPRDPRARSNSRDLLDLARMPGMAVYLVVAFGVNLTTPFVYQVMPGYLRSIGMERAHVATAMSLGQWPEVVALFGLPWLIRRWGFRATMALGIAAYAVRFGMLVLQPPLWLATAGIPLHGIGVACFSIGGQIFIDGRASRDRRASAQSLNTVATSGLGSLVGCLLAGEVVALFPGRYDLVYLVPCLICLTLLGLLWVAFRPEAIRARPAEQPPAPALKRPPISVEAREPLAVGS
jgi:MFS family permease